MKKPLRHVVAVVAADDTPSPLRGALEDAGYEVPCASAYDFRRATTTFSTFLETYKPEVIVLDLHPPADDAVKDLISFKSLPSAEGIAFVVACSHAEMQAKLPEHVGSLRLTAEDVGSVVKAVENALRARKAA